MTSIVYHKNLHFIYAYIFFPILYIKFDQQIKKSDKYCNKFTDLQYASNWQDRLIYKYYIIQLRIDKWMNTNTLQMPPSKKQSREGIPKNDSHTWDGIKPLGKSSAYIIKQKDLLLVVSNRKVIF